METAAVPEAERLRGKSGQYKGKELDMELEEKTEKKELEQPEITTYSREELEKPKTVFTGNPSVSNP